MKKALILINAYSPAITRQASRIKDELTLRGVNARICRNDFFPFSTDGELRGVPDCDFCVYLDKDKYNARLLEKAGVRLFDTAAAIELCDDKMLTHIALTSHGIPMPKTLPGLLCYYKDAKISGATLDKIERELGYPVVVKQSFGSQGSGVFKADDRTALKKIAERVKTEPHLFQKYVASSAGTDMRVIVIGGRTVGGILRRSGTDFRSNIGLGGSAVKTDVPKEIADTAEKAAAILGLDYCGIDFLTGDAPLLCEVNSNAFFDAFETATGINVAGLYAEHMIKCLGTRER